MPAGWTTASSAQNAIALFPSSAVSAAWSPSLRSCSALSAATNPGDVDVFVIVAVVAQPSAGSNAAANR
jgi:hypothetical protein